MVVGLLTGTRAAAFRFFPADHIYENEALSHIHAVYGFHALLYHAARRVYIDRCPVRPYRGRGRGHINTGGAPRGGRPRRRLFIRRRRRASCACGVLSVVPVP